MITDIRNRFLELLPGGEYADVEVLPDPQGLMATRFGTVLARATWLRMGGRPCFLKAIRIAGAHAGPETRFVSNEIRLERVRARIEAMPHWGSPPPTVQVYHARFLENEFLLFNMELVTPLQRTVDEGSPSVASAARLLVECVPPSDAPSWHHFDLCLRNLGQTPDGHIVLIDLESVYGISDNTFHVSTPTFKDWRWPHEVFAAVAAEMADGQHLSLATANRKQRFDLLLCAAELSLAQPIPGHRGRADDWLVPWLESARHRLPSLAEFWRSVLVPALRDTDTVDLQVVAKRLLEFQAEANSESREIHAERDDLQHSGHAAAYPTHLEARSEQLDIVQFAALLRNDRLTIPQMVAYYELLSGILGAGDADLDTLREMRLIAVAYLRDPALAADVVERTLSAFPEDKDASRWKNIIVNWRKTLEL